MKLNRRQLRRLIESTIFAEAISDISEDSYGNKGTQASMLKNKEGAILNAVNAELKKANLFDEKAKIFANPAPGGIRSMHFQDEYIAADIQIGPIQGGNQEMVNEKAREVMSHLGSDEAMERMSQHEDVKANEVVHVFSKRNFQISSEMGGGAYNPSVVISLNI